MKKIYFLIVFLCFTHKVSSQCSTIISGPTKACLGTTLIYSAQSPGNFPTSGFEWTLNGGGNILSGMHQVQITWTTIGVWTITATNPLCSSNSVTYQVTVTGSATIPTPLNVFGNQSVCHGTTATYSVPNQNGLTPIWNIVTTENNPLPSFTASGNSLNVTWPNINPTNTATYLLLASYSNGDCSGSQIFYPVVVSYSNTVPPPPTLNNLDKYCIGQTSVISASVQPGDSFSWSLAGGGIITPNGATAQINWISTGTFVLTLTATNSCNSTPRTVTKTITVESTPITPGSISQQSTFTCLNEVQKFSIVPVPNATTYRWSITSGSGSGNSSITTVSPYLETSFSVPGIKAISVIASNGHCDSPSSPVFTTKVGLALGIQLSAEFQVELEPVQIRVCAGTTTTISAYPIDTTVDETNFTFTWSVINGTIIGPSNGKSVSIQWNTVGEAIINVTANTPCGQITSGQSLITVQGSIFELTPITGVTQVCLGEYSYTSTAGSQGAKPSWSITNLEGEQTSAGSFSALLYEGVKINWNTPGNYTIMARSVNSCGVAKSQSINISVSNGPKPATSLINDTSYEKFCTPSYPNIRTYTVSPIAGYTYNWGFYGLPGDIMTTSNNSATVTWSGDASANLYVIPSTSTCTGEKTYLHSTHKLNSAIGELLSSGPASACANTAISTTFSVTSAIGNVTYEVRKKGDNGTWTSWITLLSPNYIIDYSGFFGQPYSTYNYEFRAIAQNETCSPAYSNVITFTGHASPYFSNHTSYFAEKEICSGSSVTIAPTSNIPGATVVWTTSTVGSVTGAPSSGSGNISHILTNTGTTTGSVTYSITATANGCSSQTYTVKRYVYPIPVLASNQIKSICSDTKVDYNILVTPEAELNWPDPDGSGPATGAANRNWAIDINDNLVNTGSSPIQVIYQVTPFNRINSTSGCSGVQKNVVITVNPKPVVTSSASVLACEGIAINHLLTSNIPANFTWRANNNIHTTGESLQDQTSNRINDVINTATNQQITYLISPVSIQGSCAGTQQTFTASIKAKVSVTHSSIKTICSGTSVNHALTSSLPVSFSWLAVDNPNVTGESLNTQNSSMINDVIFNTSGVVQTVVYNLKATSPDGCSNSYTFTLTINPQPTLTSSMSTNTCSGNTVSIPLTSTLPSTYTWKAIDNPNTTGETLTTQTSSVINNTILNTSNFAEQVIYTVTAKATVQGNCTGIPESITVLINPQPQITSSNKVICTNEYTDLALTSTLPNATYSWVVQSKSANMLSAPVGTSGTTNVINHNLGNTSSTPATITYRVTASANGCSGAFKDITVTVNPKPTAVISPSGSTTLCPTQVLSLHGTSGTGLTYQWYKDGNPLATTPYITVDSAANAGLYSLTVTNTYGCSANAQVMVTADNTTSQISPSGNLTMCEGNSITLQAGAVPLGYTLRWQRAPSSGGNWSNVSTANSYVATTAGRYRLLVTKPDNACTYTSSETVITSAAAPTPYVYQSGNLCNGYVTLSTSGGVSYLWSTGNTSQTVNMLLSGTYTVRVTYANGCSKTSAPITVYPCTGTEPCNEILSAQGRVIRPCLEEPVMMQSELSVYPNPADATITVSQPISGETEINAKLYTQYGQEIKSASFKSGEKTVTFDTKMLANGIYLIQITTPQGGTTVRKVMVKH